MSTRVLICKQKDAGPGTVVPPGNYQEEIIHYCLPLKGLHQLLLRNYMINKEAVKVERS